MPNPTHRPSLRKLSSGTTNITSLADFVSLKAYLSYMFLKRAHLFSFWTQNELEEGLVLAASLFSYGSHHVASFQTSQSDPL